MGLFLGLISGTSMDAIDAALVDFSPLSLAAASAVPFEPALKERVAALIEPRHFARRNRSVDVAVAQLAGSALPV